MGTGNGHSSCSPISRLAGRKRRRGRDAWPVQPRRLPNATVLDVIHEVDDDAEEEKEVEAGLLPLRDEKEEKLMDVRTMVFGMGANGDLRVG